ncbi:MAG TPA: VWA domain-containing protein [Thermoanaerobaculia bacterium]|nr:VWA domain-containing protein [Thermoanaerobaculia bacterium]
MSRLAAAAVLLFAVTAAAQVRETINVSVVEVPVTVVDRDGAPLRGLTKEQFEIVDDGQKRVVEGFEQIDFASRESISAISPLNPAGRRSFLLLFDLSFSSPIAIKRAQNAARDFVKRMVHRHDLLAIATVDVDLGFRLVTSFTTDRALISAAIDDPKKFRGMDPLQIAGNLPVAPPPAVAFAGTGERASAAVEAAADVMRNAGRQEDLYSRRKIDRQIGLLTSLAKVLRSVSGLKHVIFLSEGFNPKLIQGREAGASPEQFQESFAIEHGEIWKVDSDERYGSSTSLSILDAMAQMFRRSDVVLHAVDIRGLRVDNDVRSGAGRKSNEGLFLLANATGGEVFRNSNDLSGEFRRLMARQQVVYLLSFRAPTSEPGRFHRLRVRLVGVPGARVTHRAGYWEAGGESEVERSLSNAEIVLNDIPQSGVRMASLATAFPGREGAAHVPVILEIDGSDLLRAASGGVSTLELFVYAFDEEGLVRDATFQRVRLEIEKVRETLLRRGLKYYGTLALPPGRYAIRSLLRVLESDVKGYVRTDLTVPEEGEVAVSRPLFLDSADGWLMVKGRSEGAYPFFIDAEPFIPSAAVTLRSGEPRRFAVFVTNAEADETEWETTPAARLLRQVRSESGSKFLFEIEGSAAAKTVEVTLRRKGSSDERRSSLPLSPP